MRIRTLMISLALPALVTVAACSKQAEPPPIEADASSPMQSDAPAAANPEPTPAAPAGTPGATTDQNSPAQVAPGDRADSHTPEPRN